MPYCSKSPKINHPKKAILDEFSDKEYLKKLYEESQLARWFLSLNTNDFSSKPSSSTFDKIPNAQNSSENDLSASFDSNEKGMIKKYK